MDFTSSARFQIPRPSVLLFNFREDARTASIRSYLESGCVAVIRVEPKDFGTPIGALLSSHVVADKNASFSASFSEEMLVMSGFTQERLQAFLDFFREVKIARVGLKAMLTPTNAAWNAFELRRHLKAEQKRFESGKKPGR